MIRRRTDDLDPTDEAPPDRPRRVMAEIWRWERRMRGAEATPDDAVSAYEHEVKALLARTPPEADDRAGASRRDPAQDAATLPASSRPARATPLDASDGPPRSRVFDFDLTDVE